MSTQHIPVNGGWDDLFWETDTKDETNLAYTPTSREAQINITDQNEKSSID